MSNKAMLCQQPPSLSWAAASLAVQTAVAKAAELGIKVHAAVVDGNGNTLAYLRMPGAFFHSEGLAIDKAYTAASFGFPSGKWLEVAGDNERLREGLITRPRLSVLGGGWPVLHEGQCIGGIGVSGGSEEEDDLCAKAGLEALGLS